MDTLYVSRPVINWKEIAKWAQDQGFETTLGDDMHVTIVYSKAKVDWEKIPDHYDNIRLQDHDDRKVKPLGDQGAVVLGFESDELQQRHKELREIGASHGFPSYQSHITISFKGGDVDLSKVEPFTGDIHLGSERYKVIEGEFSADDVKETTAKSFTALCKVEKSVASLGIVIGFAIVCTVDGQPYYDLQGDHITEEAALIASLEFGTNRAGWDLHGFGENGTKPIGKVVQMFMLTQEIADAMGIKTRKTGLMIMMKIEDQAILTKFENGSYTGFSIGGKELEVETL